MLSVSLHHDLSLHAPMACALIGGRVHVLLNSPLYHAMPAHMRQTLLSTLLASLGFGELDTLRLCRDLERQMAPVAALAGCPVFPSDITDVTLLSQALEGSL